MGRNWEPPREILGFKANGDPIYGKYIYGPMPFNPAETDNRAWVRIVCPWTDEFGTWAGWIRIDNNPPADFIHEMAIRRLRVPEPQGDIYPLADFQTVHWPTWLWIDPSAMDTVTETAAIDLNGQPWASVTATATTDGVWWNMGNPSREHPDGEWLFCAGAGTPPPRAFTTPTEGPCSHTYTNTSAEAPDLRFDVHPYLNWTINAACDYGCQRTFDPITLLRQGPAIPVRVGEIQAILTDP